MAKYVVKYTYKNYPNCPRATEISRSRASAKHILSYFCAIGLLFGIGELFLHPAVGAATLLVTVVVLVYLNTGYNKRTEKNIEKALAEQLGTQQMLRDSRYQCDALTRLHDAGIGQCMNCYTKNTKIARYRVTRGSETREMPICEACAARLEASLPENAGKNRQNSLSEPAPKVQAPPMTPRQQALELEFANVFLQSNSAPLGDRQQAWNWMMGKMRYFRQQGLGTQELFALASNMMMFLTDIYSRSIPEFLTVAEPKMIVAQVAQLYQEQKLDKAKQIAIPFWEYSRNHMDSLQLDKNDVIILAMVACMKTEQNT